MKVALTFRPAHEAAVPFAQAIGTGRRRVPGHVGALAHGEPAAIGLPSNPVAGTSRANPPRSDTMGTNAEFVSAMQAQINRWDAEVLALAAEGRKTGGELRTAFARRLKELRLHRTAAQKSLHQVREASEAAGAKLQAGMQAAWDTMQHSLEKVSTELRKPAQAPVPAPPAPTASAIVAASEPGSESPPQPTKSEP